MSPRAVRIGSGSWIGVQHTRTGVLANPDIVPVGSCERKADCFLRRHKGSSLPKADRVFR